MRIEELYDPNGRKPRDKKNNGKNKIKYDKKYNNRMKR